MPWQFAIAISLAAGVISTLLQRRYTQTVKSPWSFPSAASYLFGVLPIGYVAALFIFPHHISWSWWVAFLLVVEAISMTSCNWFSFYTSSKMKVAPRLTINQFSTVAVVFLGWTLLSEKLTLAQCIGGALLISGALLAAWAPVRTSKGVDRALHLRYVIMAITGALSMAVGLVTEKALLRHMDIGGVFLVGWTAQTAGMVLFALKDFAKPTARLFTHRDLRQSALIGATNGLTGTFYVYSIFHSDNISLISVIISVSLPLTVLAAYVFLHERERQKLVWLSLLLACVGLAWLSF